MEVTNLNSLTRTINAQISKRNVAILVDHNTKNFCLSRIEDDLNSSLIVIETSPGESNKSLSALESIYKSLSNSSLGRDDLLVNLGGGVITDIGGFAASTYKRGIDFWNIPTTLLAMVDAANGGKNGINFLNYKNYIGTFNNANRTLLCMPFLESLPKRELVSGKAEMIKHSLISDIQKDLFKHIDGSDPFSIPSESSILRSSSIKNEIVKQDPKEEGLRKILNFGHTIGHAVESAFASKEKTIMHGEAIALGMHCALDLSVNHCNLNSDNAIKVQNIIRHIFGKVNLSENEIQQVGHLCRKDKKNNSKSILFVLLEELGKPIYDIPVSVEDIHQALFAYSSS